MEEIIIINYKARWANYEKEDKEKIKKITYRELSHVKWKILPKLEILTRC